MNFRRLPFQFTTTDPAERTRELERRFGLPSNQDMFVDVANPLSMGAVSRESNMSASSPRLQHRVPIFVNGYNQPIHSSVDSTAPTSENKKPNVRVIPIEVEEPDNRSARHRTLSGPVRTAYEQGDECPSRVNALSPLKRSVEDSSAMNAVTSGPRIHTIPIKVESSNKSTKIPKFEKSAKPSQARVNGCSVSKSSALSKSSVEANEPEGPDAETGIANSLEKIQSVLEQLKIYETVVQEFSGTTKDKQYRYLDEMLTQCMIKLDDVDTMGNNSVRLARKNAVKDIQAQLDLLESKANAGISPSVPDSSPVKTTEIQEFVLATKELPSTNEVKRGDLEMVSGELLGDDEVEVPLGRMEDEAPMCHDSNLVTSKEVEMEANQLDSGGGHVKSAASDDLASSNSACKVPPDSEFIEADSSSPVHESVGEQTLSTTQDVDMKDVQNITSDDQGDAEEENSSEPKDNCKLEVITEKTGSCDNIQLQ